MTIQQIIGATILISLAGAGLAVMVRETGWADTAKATAFSLSVTAAIVAGVVLLVPHG